MVEARLLHSGGSDCPVNMGGSCLHSGGLWRPGVSTLVSPWVKLTNIKTM